MTECPTIENLKRYGLLKAIDADTLIAHWKECKYCKQTLEEIRKNAANRL